MPKEKWSHHERKDHCELSVIAPVYRSESHVQELTDRLIKALGSITDDFEILLIDDGSPDRVWDRIREAAIGDARVKGIRFSRNFGQHPALTAGIDHARGRWLVVMDGDLQDSPEDVPVLYEAARAGGYDVVIARRSQQDISIAKNVSSQIFNWTLAWLGDVETNQRIGNFRIFSRQVAAALLLYREQFRFFPALMARLGFRIGFHDVSRSGRRDGRSSYRLRGLVRLATDAIIANSEKPLWLGIYLGLIVSCLGFLLALWALMGKLLYNSPIQGWASVFIAVSFFSGVQLLFSGLIGIYVGRVFHETKGRPIYIVAEFLDLTESPPNDRVHERAEKDTGTLTSTK